MRKVMIIGADEHGFGIYPKEPPPSEFIDLLHAHEDRLRALMDKPVVLSLKRTRKVPSQRSSAGIGRWLRPTSRWASDWSSSSPKVLEPVGRHVGIPDRVLNVLVPEVVLQGPRVMAIVRELEPTGMAKHVWVDREWHLGSLTEALDKPVETYGADWPAALGNEYVGVCRVIAA